MYSIAKNDLRVIDFLVRNFSEMNTMRNIALKLKISAAGVHSVLKKLESENFVQAQKLGTGLFYKINFENNIAKYLASIALLEHKAPKKLQEIGEGVISKGTDLLIISSSFVEPLEGYKCEIIGQEEFVEKLKEKNPAILKMLKEGQIAAGEEIILNAIMEASK